jgi:hypothetical protein
MKYLKLFEDYLFEGYSMKIRPMLEKYAREILEKLYSKENKSSGIKAYTGGPKINQSITGGILFGANEIEFPINDKDFPVAGIIIRDEKKKTDFFNEREQDGSFSPSDSVKVTNKKGSKLPYAVININANSKKRKYEVIYHELFHAFRWATSVKKNGLISTVDINTAFQDFMGNNKFKTSKGAYGNIVGDYFKVLKDLVYYSGEEEGSNHIHNSIVYDNNIEYIGIILKLMKDFDVEKWKKEFAKYNEWQDYNKKFFTYLENNGFFKNEKNQKYKKIGNMTPDEFLDFWGKIFKRNGDSLYRKFNKIKLEYNLEDKYKNFEDELTNEEFDKLSKEHKIRFISNYATRLTDEQFFWCNTLSKIEKENDPRKDFIENAEILTDKQFEWYPIKSKNIYIKNVLSKNRILTKKQFEFLDNNVKLQYYKMRSEFGDIDEEVQEWYNAYSYSSSNTKKIEEEERGRKKEEEKKKKLAQTKNIQIQRLIQKIGNFDKIIELKQIYSAMRELKLTYEESQDAELTIIRHQKADDPRISEYIELYKKARKLQNLNLETFATLLPKEEELLFSLDSSYDNYKEEYLRKGKLYRKMSDSVFNNLSHDLKKIAIEGDKAPYTTAQFDNLEDDLKEMAIQREYFPYDKSFGLLTNKLKNLVLTKFIGKPFYIKNTYSFDKTKPYYKHYNDKQSELDSRGSIYKFYKIYYFFQKDRNMFNYYINVYNPEEKEKILSRIEYDKMWIYAWENAWKKGVIDKVFKTWDKKKRKLFLEVLYDHQQRVADFLFDILTDEEKRYCIENDHKYQVPEPLPPNMLKWKQENM